MFCLKSKADDKPQINIKINVTLISRKTDDGLSCTLENNHVNLIFYRRFLT